MPEVRLLDRDLVVAEVDEDPLVEQSFGTEDALRTAKCVRDDRQAVRPHLEVANYQAVDRDRRHCPRAGDAAQHDLVRLEQRQAEVARNLRRDGRMTRTGIEHEAERTLAVDEHRRPDAADPVAPRGSDVAWLGSLDDDLVHVVRRRRTRRRRLVDLGWRNIGRRRGWRVRSWQSLSRRLAGAEESERDDE
jgi:hypothetical protein